MLQGPFSARTLPVEILLTLAIVAASSAAWSADVGSAAAPSPEPSAESVLAEIPFSRETAEAYARQELPARVVPALARTLSGLMEELL